MCKGSKFLVTTIALLAWALSFPDQGWARSLGLQRPAGGLTPENTVILANETDARFSRDFSVLLNSLRLEWAVVDSATVPDPAKDKNLILLGRLDAAHTGELMRGLLTAQEIERIRTAGEGHLVLAKASPWAEGKSVYICTGADLLQTKGAAEEAVRTIVAASPPASAWIASRFDAPADEDLSNTLDRLRYSWQDAELPLAELMTGVAAKPRRSVSASQAAEDVERLFYLFAHGYSGYGFFDQAGEFARAKARILEELSARSRWSTEDLGRLLHEHLGFITDCHLRIGGIQYASHHDFWYDTRFEVVLGEEGYQATVDGAAYTVVSINDQDPGAFLFPSLNPQGAPIYRLGTLSEAEPAPLALAAMSGDGQARRFEITLQRSDFAYYSDDLFREDRVGGIPIIRIRSFSDVPVDPVSQFVETARAHRGEPVIILDIRGNGGGNEAWPVRWIQGLTGRRAEAVFVSSELHSKTTMAGRANLFAEYYDQHPDSAFFRQEGAWYSSLAQAIEDGTRQPGWTAPRYPKLPLIPNDTTVIIVMNGLVASAGEGLVMRASQAENVVLVGENSMGALTFGNISSHQLPHSRLQVRMPINFGLCLDMEFREGEGIAPDLWLPAADAVNYAVAAVRSGTIATQQPLSPATLAQPFVPEDSWARVRPEMILGWLVTAGLAVVGTGWAYYTRKKPWIVIGVGIVWLLIGGAWMLAERAVGFGFLFAGVVCLVWGGINLLRTRKAPVEASS